MNHEITLDYRIKRRGEYPPAADYLDARAKRDDAALAAYFAACRAVKDKYPKPVPSQADGPEGRR